MLSHDEHPGRQGGVHIRRVRALSPEQVAAERAALHGSSGQPGAVELPAAQQGPPVAEPTTPPPVALPGSRSDQPVMAPEAGSGTVALPGAPSTGSLEAASRRSRTGRGGGRQMSEDYTDPLTGEPFEGEVLQPNRRPPTYDPATGRFEDPDRGISKQGFNSAEEALERFNASVEAERQPLTMDIAGAEPVRSSSISSSADLHIPVYSAQGVYAGTIFRNVIGGHTFYTFSRGSH
jgi:hypothetical protein